MEEERFKVFEKLYKKYGFVEDDISKFDEILFHNAEIDGLTEQEIEKLATKNLFKHICSIIEEKGIVELFDKAVATLSISKAFAIFDTILEETNIEVYSEDIETISTNDKYKEYYEKIIKKNKKTIEEDNYDSIKGNLLRQVIEAVVIFSNDYEEEVIFTQDYDTVTDDIFHDYLREIGKYPLLTKEEEQELFRRYHKGDEDAFQKLVAHNLRLVVNVTKKKMNPYTKLHIMDYVDEGNIGLMKAITKFDPKKTGKLSTYAVWWIQQAVTRAMSDKDNEIRLPVYMLEKVKKYKKFIGEYKSRYAEDPTDDIIMQELGFDKATLKKVKTAEKFRDVDSIDRTIDSGGNSDSDTALHEFIYDSELYNPETETIEKVYGEAVRNMLKSTDLTDRERKVLILRYGLDNGREKTLDEVGKEVGVTRERIRQIESKGIRKLRRSEEGKKIEEKEKTDTYQSKYAPVAFRGHINSEKLFFNNYREAIKSSSNETIDVIEIDKDHKKVKVECKKCNTVWNTTYDFLLKNCYCPECYEREIESRELGLKELIIDASKFSIISNENGKILLKCNDCGTTITTEDKKEKNNPKCKTCFKREKQKDLRMSIQKNLDDLSNGKIELIEYSSQKQETEVKCRECGFSWKKAITKIYDSPYCPQCQKQNKTNWDIDLIKKYLSTKTNNTLEVTKVEKGKFYIRCKTCNEEWVSTKAQILCNSPLCRKCSRKDPENKFIKQMKALSQDKLEFSGYTNSSSKLNVTCKECGQTWDIRPAELKHRCYCPYCDKRKPKTYSQGKKTIYDFVAYPKEQVDEEIAKLTPREQNLIKKREVARYTKQDNIEFRNIVAKLRNSLSVVKESSKEEKEKQENAMIELLAEKYQKVLSQVGNDKRLMDRVTSMEYVMTGLRFGLLSVTDFKPLEDISELYGKPVQEIEITTDYIMNVMTEFVIERISNKEHEITNNLQKDIRLRLAKNYQQVLTVFLSDVDIPTISIRSILLTSLRFGLREGMAPLSIHEIGKTYDINPNEVLRITDETLDILQQELIKKINTYTDEDIKKYKKIIE